MKRIKFPNAHVNMTPETSDRWAELSQLTGETAWIEFNEEVGAWAVWICTGEDSEDIAGSGASPRVAIDDAIQLLTGEQLESE